MTYTSSGTYIAAVDSDSSCDSLVAINVNITIPFFILAIFLDGTTLTASMDDVAYQWVDCNDDYAPIDGATDQSFNIVTEGSYAVVLDNGICTDTSACYVYSVSSFNFLSLSVSPTIS
ncbi:MAG: hypothetical protein P8I55_14150 [Crocinitomix sp.]|nr:hypothetical protein [Crocinitomix sp.]